jgi:hypothetical protein
LMNNIMKSEMIPWQQEIPQEISSTIPPEITTILSNIWHDWKISISWNY